MRERLTQFARTVLERWRALERRQKIAVVSVAAFLLMSLGVAIFLLTRTVWIDLVINGEPQTNNRIKAALTEQNIPYREYLAGRQLKVREQDKDKALSITFDPELGLPDTFTLADAASLIGMSTPGDVATQAILRSKVSYVESLIRNIAGVTDVKIEPDIPPQSTFFRNMDRVGTASVMLTTNGAVNSRLLGETVANAVASSFMDISKENVFVTDQNGAQLYGGVDASDMSNTTGQRQENENVKARLYADEVRKVIAPYGDAVVSFNPVFDYTSTEEESERYYNPTGQQDSSTGFITSQGKEAASATNVNNDGEPGLGTNDQVTSTYEIGAANGGEASLNKSDTQYAYDKVRTYTKDDNYGRLVPERSTGSATLLQVTTLREENYAPEEHNDLTWAQYKEASQLPTFTEGDDLLKRSIAGVWGVPTDNVTVTIAHAFNFIDAQKRSIPFETIALFVILAVLIMLLAYGFIRKIQPDEVTEVEPELSVEELLVSTKLEEEKIEEEKKLAELQAIEFSEDSEIKKQIMKFVDEKPEAVAQLLRNWINEDWE